MNTKNSHVDKLIKFRDELLGMRRESALENNLANTVKYQVELEVIERAIEDEKGRRPRSTRVVETRL